MSLCIKRASSYEFVFFYERSSEQTGKPVNMKDPLSQEVCDLELRLALFPLKDDKAPALMDTGLLFIKRTASLRCDWT